jgi:RNA polymerase sigma-70 factor (ECF subfamily)
VSAAAAQRDLADALASLAAGDREVLLLIAWAELAYDEVAVALGIPVGTVRSRLHRAAQRAGGTQARPGGEPGKRGPMARLPGAPVGRALIVPL